MENIVGSALELSAKGFSDWMSSDYKYGMKILFFLFNI